MKDLMLTWVSGSWKTSIQIELLEKYWYTMLYNYTTREKRSDSELDNYIFITEEQFFKKLKNGDFAEFTQYNGNFYAMSKYSMKSAPICVILEPVGREMMEKLWKEEWREYITIFLDITPEEQESRLEWRWDSVKEIEKRKKDFEYFKSRNHDSVINVDWKSKQEVLDEVLLIIQ